MVKTNAGSVISEHHYDAIVKNKVNVHELIKGELIVLFSINNFFNISMLNGRPCSRVTRASTVQTLRNWLIDNFPDSYYIGKRPRGSIAGNIVNRGIHH